MGWRERDWAKLTDEERRPLYGTSGSAAPLAGGRFGARGGATLAVAISAALFLVGQLPSGDPLVPALHVGLPSIGSDKATAQRVHKLNLPAVSSRGSRIVITGQIADRKAGRGEILGHWNAQPWKRLGSFDVGRDGTYTTTIKLSRTGMLNIRMTFPSGEVATGATRVRR